jgi:hypothetical protein
MMTTPGVWFAPENCYSIMSYNDPLKGHSIKAWIIFTHGLSNFRSSKSVYSEGIRQAILGILF